MRTSQQDSLYQLVKSLTAHEKSYIKRYAFNTKKADKYKALFDVFAAMKHYDEGYITKKLKRYKLKLAPAKNYLANLIIKKLVDYHANNDLDIEMHQLLSEGKILQDKGLYQAARQRYNKYESLCERYDFFSRTPEVHMRMYSMESAIPENQEHINNLLSKRKENLNQLTRRIALDSLLEELLMLRYNMGMSIRNAKDRAAVERILNHKALNDWEDFTPSLKLISCQIKMVCYSLIQDLPLLLKELESCLLIYENNNDFRSLRLGNYYTDLLNYMYVYGVIYGAEKAKKEVARFNRIIEEADDKESKRLNESYKNRAKANLVKAFMEEKNYEAGAELADEIVDDIDTFSTEGIWHENIQKFARCYFMAGRYDKALDMVNELLDSSRVKKLDQFYIHAKLFQIAIHYDLGNFLLIERLTSNLYREMRRKGLLDEKHQAVLKFIKQLSQSKPQEKKIFKAFYQTIQPYEDEVENKELITFFDLVGWVKKKAMG